MVLPFTCGMKAHTPVMYTGSEQGWRTKNKNWQTVDAWMKCATPETAESTSRKNNIFRKA